MDKKYVVDSFLSNRGIPDLVAGDGVTPQKQELYQRLRNCLHFVFDDNFVAVWKIFFGYFTSANGTRVGIQNDAMFAAVDHSDTLKVFGYRIALYMRFKSAVQPKARSFYTMRMFWMIKTNFFAKIFAQGLTHLVEGGIYQKWYKHYSVVEHEGILRIQFNQILKNENVSIAGEDAEATTVEQVRVPFVLYLGMSLGSAAVFMQEIKHILKRLMQNAYYAGVVSFRKFAIRCHLLYWKHFN